MHFQDNKTSYAPHGQTVIGKYAGFCPECHTKLVFAEASFYCPNCGFSENDFMLVIDK